MLIKRQSKFKLPISNFQFPKNLGFSLIELLVVISILAVLTAVLVANFMGVRERARDAQKIQNLHSLKDSLRMYYNDYQQYPASGYLNVLVGESYVASIENIGYTYTQINEGDGFVLKVGLEAGAGDEDIESQKKCGISPVNKIFAVCAN